MRAIMRIGRRVWAAFLIAALMTTIALARPDSSAGSAQERARSGPAGTQNADSFKPGALGRDARPDAAVGTPRRSLWPWIVGGLFVLGGVAAYALLQKPKDRARPQVGDVDPQALGVRIVSPNADTAWGIGDLVRIEWSTDKVDFAGFPDGPGGLGFRIELLKAGQHILTIQENTNNDGAENWVVPAALAPGADYAIRVICASAEAAFGEGGPFIIGARKTETFNWNYYDEGRPEAARFLASRTARAELKLSGNGRVERVECLAHIGFDRYVTNPKDKLTDVGLLGPGGTRQELPFFRNVGGGRDPVDPQYYRIMDGSVGKLKAGSWVFSATYFQTSTDLFIYAFKLILTYLEW